MTRIITKPLGFLLLAIYLILVGLLGLVTGAAAPLHAVVSVVAIAAGVCILLGK